jgi:hypothetical protein
MSERSPDVETLTAVLAERAQEGGGGAGPDPEPEELLDYLEGRLSQEEDAAMQRRLVASPAATRRLLDLAGLVDAGAAGERQGGEEGEAAGAPADLAVHAAWRDFRWRLPGGEAEAGPTGGPAPLDPSRLSDRPASAGRATRWNALSGGLAALAATLLVAVLALGTWVSRLERASGPGGGVVANLRTLEVPQATRAEGLPSSTVAPGEPLLVLLEAPPEPCPSYRAEIVTPAGALREVPGLVRDELGNLSFLLQGEHGRYAVRLFGCEPERQLSTYGFEILPSGGATSD